MKKIITLLLWVTSFYGLHAQIQVTFPAERYVVQRTEGATTLYLRGRISQPADAMQARLLTRPGEGGSPLNWTTFQNNPAGGVFSGSIQAAPGRYTLEIRAVRSGVQTGASATVEKVGIGEVFVIAGHSNAAGAPPSLDYAEADPSLRDRVNAINWNSSSPTWNAYWNTGNTAYLPELRPSQLCQSCGMAPGTDIPWFWGRMGELLVKQLDVPVMFYSAAFGGSNIEQAYFSAYNMPFDHGFILYVARHPYVNLRNSLTHYVPKTGLRAVLCGHGVNDRDTTGLAFKNMYQLVIDKTREITNAPAMAWLVATSCWINGECVGQWTFADGPSNHIRRAQEEMILEKSEVYQGANLNQIDNSGRYDNLHFSLQGQEQAAQLWKQAILSENLSRNFLLNSQPVAARAPPVPTPVGSTVSIASGQWHDPETWGCHCVPTYATNVTISSGHTVSITDQAYTREAAIRGVLHIEQGANLHLHPQL